MDLNWSAASDLNWKKSSVTVPAVLEPPACQAEADGNRAHHGGGAHGQTLQSRRCMWGIGQHNC